MTSSDRQTPGILHGKVVTFVGKLASMSRRDAAQLVREHGGATAEKPGPGVQVVVVGEQDLPLPGGAAQEEPFDAPTLAALERGDLEVVAESRFWQQLGLVEAQHEVHRLYTPAELAELLSVPLAVIRRWHRRGLIVPIREVRRLPYFNFEEVATARRLAELLAAGVSPRAIERQLAALAGYLPRVQRPLAQLSVIVQGKEILLRQGDGLLEVGGQFRFDFDAAEVPAASTSPVESPVPSAISLADHRLSVPLSSADLTRAAAELEEAGQLEAAVEMCRAALAAGGPNAELCFQTAELLYRLGDLTAARERYFMAIEIDENYVEARANLGCVLAETGQHELAAAAFEGALRYHAGYADVHYHLARTLDELQRADEAAVHWQAFLDLSPDSPWAAEAHERLARSS
jgi:tetratricopeptide (TPR) repeat protein